MRLHSYHKIWMIMCKGLWRWSLNNIPGMKLPKYKTLPFGVQIKGGFSTHKYSSRCPRLILSSKPRALWWPCCVYLSRTSWSITPKLGWTQRSWRLVSWLLKIKLCFFISRLDQPHYCLSNRKQLKWCALCQNVAMTWWMWADFKALRYFSGTRIILRSLQNIFSW